MKLVRGKKVAELGREETAAMLSGYARVVVDVGTGDGRFAYAYARDHPDAFVVGIDLVKENLREASQRAGRKPERGGLHNVAYVWARAEDPPAELAGVASEVYVVLPWGRLLDGLVLGERDVLDGLASLAAPCADVKITLNCEVWGENVPIKVRHLPELTPEYARGTLAGPYARSGLLLSQARMLSRDEVQRLSSPWAKRLRQGRDWPRFLYLEAVAS